MLSYLRNKRGLLQCMNSNQNNKLLYMGSTYQLLEEKERKKHVEGKKEKKKKKECAFARPILELSHFMLSQLSNTVY